jgi:hypothetical protein
VTTLDDIARCSLVTARTPIRGGDMDTVDPGAVGEVIAFDRDSVIVDFGRGAITVSPEEAWPA